MLLEALDEVHRINGLRRAGTATRGDAQLKCPGFDVRNDSKLKVDLFFFYLYFVVLWFVL